MAAVVRVSTSPGASRIRKSAVMVDPMYVEDYVDPLPLTPVTASSGRNIFGRTFDRAAADSSESA
jgi:hypothetical protein